MTLRPPTYVEKRRCGDCLHLQDAGCHHPLAEWNFGFDDFAMLKKFRPQWPPRHMEDWCGFWRPAPSPSTEPLVKEYGL